MSQNDLPTGATDLGGITVVGDSTPAPRGGSRKRTREEAGLPEAEHLEEAPAASRIPAGSVAAQVDIQGEGGGIWGADSEEDKKEERSPVQRLLDAKHRRRRLGKHMAQDQIQEDIEDVKKFQEMSDADKEAYLAIYEYDGSGEHLLEGLAKASALVLRGGLALTVHPKDFDLASMALDMPEVKDSIATMVDALPLKQYEGTQAVQVVASIGHVGDTLLGAAMKLYQGIARAAEIRQRAEQIERRKSQGIQSQFDLTGNNGIPPGNAGVPSPATGQAPAQPVLAI